MTRSIQLIALAWFFLFNVSCSNPEAKTEAAYMAAGRQPQIAVDSKGTIRVVYGQDDSIYCATSIDNGETFSKPELVGQVEGLYLGMSMGPQIASSANYSMVTAIDKKGNIHSFRLSPGANAWAKAASVNDIPGSVPEGLMSIDADENDTFYAVWLDVRDGKQNKIVFASTSGEANTWSSNKVVYASPDKTVCECCKPSIDVMGNQVVLMFRNWLDGARDFYLTRSTDGGKNFDQPQKLGTGTWKLEGCPMDGGGIFLDSQHMIHTAWQRDGNIFYAQPSKPEVQIGQGRNCRVSGAKDLIISWKDGADLKVKHLSSGRETTVGTGSYIETIALADQKFLCVWEDKGKIHFRKI
jgi:hypothetical protein